MPAKNTIKIYEENAYYHLYNRGANKQKIFLDHEDHSIFLSYLKLYLTPPHLQGLSVKEISPSRQLCNYADQIDLLSYCLMDNHFHLQIKQYQQRSINYFMKSLLTKYAMFFNKKYQHSGHLFQGPYKAVKIESEAQLVYLSKYIHLNPGSSRIIPEGKTYSSLPNYHGLMTQGWVKPKEILELFSSTTQGLTYSDFINSDDNEIDITGIILEDEDI